MKSSTIVLGLSLGMSFGVANAQVINLASTNPGGLVHSLATAIAKASTEDGLRAVVVPAGGSSMPAVVNGEAECSFNIVYDLSWYVTGSRFYEAEGEHPNLKMLGAVLPSVTGIFVRQDSDVETFADLRGHRLPGGFNAQPVAGALIEAHLKMADLTEDDVEIVPVQSIVQAADDFAAGRIDAFNFSLGASKVLEVDSTVGGVRLLSVEDTEENRQIVSEVLPGATLVPVEPSRDGTITAPSVTTGYDIVMFCGAEVADDIVYRLTKAIYENQPSLAESYSAMERFDPQAMHVEVAGVDYHPGALKFYREVGLAE